MNFSCQVGGIPQGIEPILSKYFPVDDLVAVNEAMMYAGIAAMDAYQDAGLIVPNREDNSVDFDTGAIIGTGIGGMDTISEKIVPRVLEGKVRRLGSTIVEQVMGSSVSARIGGIFALGNQVTSNSSACSTGTEAIIMGTERIRSGRARRMIVGGSEGSSPFSWAGFDSMRVLAKDWNDDPTKASRPMSQSAKGFVPSSGSGILILEQLDSAVKRGARIYAEIIGGCINSGGMRNSGSMTAPSPDGVRRCIRSAVLEAKIQAHQIGYVNGHLTGTMADPMEIQNWLAALELAPEKFPAINSTKSMIGHSLGATGAIESIATVLQMTNNFVHGSLNCEDLHKEIELVRSSVVQQTVEREFDIAAKASFGFGDVNACIIFKKWRN
jgi:3-oxoacyl-(acyl-carrier-protein) synthase